MGQQTRASWACDMRNYEQDMFWRYILENIGLCKQQRWKSRTEQWRHYVLIPRRVFPLDPTHYASNTTPRPARPCATTTASDSITNIHYGYLPAQRHHDPRSLHDIPHFVFPAVQIHGSSHNTQRTGTVATPNHPCTADEDKDIWSGISALHQEAEAQTWVSRQIEKCKWEENVEEENGKGPKTTESLEC